MLIVNADDFGACESVNRAIARAFSEGAVSSATIMANLPGFQGACEVAEQLAVQERIGVHINITAGYPLTDAIRNRPAFCDETGRFCFRRNKLWRLSPGDRAALAAEVRAQVSLCQEHGLALTHADSHHHAHTEVAVFAVIGPVLKELGVRAVRLTCNSVRKPPAVALYKRLFNAWLRRQGFWTTDYLADITALDERPARSGGKWEIMTHPGMGRDGVVVDLGDGLPLGPRIREILNEDAAAPYPRGVGAG